MMARYRVPLAWHNVTANKGRLVLSVAGITFSVFLMFMQIGFRNAMRDSAVELIRLLDGDLFLVSSTKYRLFTVDPFPRRRLTQVKSHAQIESAHPLYMEMDRAFWKNPQRATQHTIRVLAFNPAEPIFLIPDINRRRAELTLPDTALVDVQGRRFLGRAAVGAQTELTRQSIRVIGHFRLGTDFAVDGNVVMSDRNFLKFFADRRVPRPQLTRIEIGILKVAEGADAAGVQASLTRALPGDVKVLTRRELRALERGYWDAVSPMGPIFLVGTAVAFVVGLVICYQVLFTDMAAQLPQFATLKAIGYGHGYLTRVILIQASLLAVMSFVVGAVLGWTGYRVVAEVTGLPMRFTVAAFALLLVLTFLMCLLAGMIAARKVLLLDPAELF